MKKGESSVLCYLFVLHYLNSSTWIKYRIPLHFSVGSYLRKSLGHLTLK